MLADRDCEDCEERRGYWTFMPRRHHRKLTSTNSIANTVACSLAMTFLGQVLRLCRLTVYLLPALLVLVLFPGRC